MRMTLQKYLGLDGVTSVGLAKKMGRSRETIRRWVDDPDLTSLIEFDVKTGKVSQIEIGQTKIIKAKN